MRPIITILSDFGTADGYVAQIKGVLLSSLPDANIIDVSHDVAAHDVDAARLTIARYWRRFPDGCVHIAIVDPGVGSSRAALAMKCDGRYLVGPDNGILSPALLLPGAEVVSLPVPASASPTFHGRDIFAPAAIALASGIDISSLGMPTLQPVIRRTPEPQRLADGGLEGQVISIDRFGNAITNLMAVSVTAAAGRGGVTVDVAGRSVPIARTYSDVVSGQPCALIGSTGLMEIAVRDGSAATTLNLSRGAPVVLRAWHR